MVKKKTAKETAAIREISQNYHVSLARAESIYYSHLQAERKHRKLVRLDQRSLGKKRS